MHKPIKNDLKKLRITLASIALMLIVACSTTSSVNQKPVVEDLSLTVDSGQTVTVSFSGSDADDESFSYEVVTQPSHGTLSIINIDKVVYTPNSDYVGQDSFSYAGRDTQGLGVSAKVQISVNEINTAPQISNQSLSVVENKAATTLVGTVIANDAQDTSLNYEIVGGNAAGMFSIVATTGEVRLAKVPDFEVQSSYPLQVKVSDSGGLSKTATVTVQVTNVNYGKVIFIGDSITRGWGSAGGTGWPLKVRNALNTNFAGDFTTQNKGIDGDTAIGLKNRLTAQVTSQTPQYVTVQIGTNDVYDNSGVAPASATAAAFETQVAAILQSLKATTSIEQVFVLGIISPVKSRTDIIFPNLISIPQTVLDANVAAYNAALKRQATARGFVFVDLAAEFPTLESARLAWLPDGVHPSEAGYNRIASIVEAQLRTKFN